MLKAAGDRYLMDWPLDDQPRLSLMFKDEC